MKPSPFPGMDPYLEDAKVWPAFHRQFVNGLCHILLSALPDRYHSRVRRRRYRADGAEEHEEEYLEIVQRGDDRLMTLVDLVSPANKTTAAGRTAYLDTRREAKKAGASLVEIDLVMQGQPTLEYSRDGLPEWDHAVTVTRSKQPERFEIYTATLQKRLPRFRLSLAPDDRDTVLDLQAVFTHCFAQGGFADRIDYRQDPPVPLSEENRRWIAEMLKRQLAPGPSTDAGSAEPPVISDERVAVLAYHLWEKEGCPPERDQEFWHRALEQLRREATGPGDH